MDPRRLYDLKNHLKSLSDDVNDMYTISLIQEVSLRKRISNLEDGLKAVREGMITRENYTENSIEIKSIDTLLKGGD